MKETLIVLAIIYCFMTGLFGSLMLAMSCPTNYGSYIWFWEYLREKFKIIGCIIIYVLTLPAVFIMIAHDIFWNTVEIICTIFEKIFRK